MLSFQDLRAQNVKPLRYQVLAGAGELNPLLIDFLVGEDVLYPLQLEFLKLIKKQLSN